MMVSHFVPVSLQTAAGFQIIFFKLKTQAMSAFLLKPQIADIFFPLQNSQYFVLYRKLCHFSDPDCRVFFCFVQRNCQHLDLNFFFLSSNQQTRSIAFNSLCTTIVQVYEPNIIHELRQKLKKNFWMLGLVERKLNLLYSMVPSQLERTKLRLWSEPKKITKCKANAPI